MSLTLRACGIFMLLATALIGQAPDAGAARDRPRRIAAFGDSLLAEAGSSLERFGVLRGALVDVEAERGSALCDWLTPIQAAVADPSVPVVVVAFTGNNLTPCASDGAGRGQEREALGDLYANGTAQVMEQARPTTRVLWVTAPANRRPNPDGDAVREAIVRTASGFPNASIVDGGALLTPGGRWSASQPCLFFEPCAGPMIAGVRHNVVRAPDGAHLCPSGATPCPVYSSGAVRYAVTILGAALEALDP